MLAMGMKALATIILMSGALAGHVQPSLVLPRPTQPQTDWQKNEIMALIHFNMATFFKNGDPGCDASNWAESQKPESFMPTNLNVSQWIESMKALGVKEAVLTAKHGCGFAIWPTEVKLPNGQPYGYSVNGSLNVLEQFTTAMQEAGLGHGFYYSLTNNFYLNVAGHYVSKRPLLPGQQNVTQTEFEAIALAQVTELWSKFSSLNEIWFDGGYTTDMESQLQGLLSKLQPDAIGMNGGGISPNPVRWSGTEGDNPGSEVWSTACGNTDWGAGKPAEDCNPQPAMFYPSATDYTLQAGDVWFWEPGVKDGGSQTLRPVDELIFTYHNTVGHNTVLELDFAIDRHGLVEDSHAALYRRFGDWIKECYSDDFKSVTINGTVAQLVLGAEAVPFDRVVLQENQELGQRVRGYTVEYTFDNVTWHQFSTGLSIGNKRIDLAPSGFSYNATQIRLNITSSVAPLPIVTLKVYPLCLTGTLDSIAKIGTEDIGMTETTPVVFDGQLYRFESVRSGNWNNTLGKAYLRFREQSGPPYWTTGDIATEPFGIGWELACAMIWNNQVFAFASQETQEIAAFSSPTISATSVWKQYTALTLPSGWTAFNTAVASNPDTSKFAMAVEVRAPKLGGGFNLVFATASNPVGPFVLQGGINGPGGLMFGPGSCPALRYDANSGYYHMLYTPNPTVPGGDYRTWQIYAARSKTLQFGDWELSLKNPIMVADAFDRQMHNLKIPADQAQLANSTENLNNSDPDLVEFDGQVLFVLNWGDQRTTPTNSLAQAVFNGTMEQFWHSLYS